MYIIKNGNEEKIKLHDDTVKFACITPQVQIIIESILDSLVSFLHWRTSSKILLFHILGRLAEASSFESRHADFAMDIWQGLGESGAVKKLGKHLKWLKEDMRASGFQAVWVPPRNILTNDAGEYFSTPTRYERREFWFLYEAVQEAAKACDLFSMPVKARRKKVLSICESWFRSHEYQPIEREQAKMKNEKQLRLVPEPEPELEPGRVTKDDVERRFANGLEILFGCGIDWANLGLPLTDYWRKINAGVGEIDDRLQHATARKIGYIADRMNARRKAVKK